MYVCIYVYISIYIYIYTHIYTYRSRVFRYSADTNTFLRRRSNEANVAARAGDGKYKIRIRFLPQIPLVLFGM